METRRAAVIFARGRTVVGLALVLLPGPLARRWFGADHPALRAALRMIGVRDVVLGLGALTAVKEGQGGPEWLGMGAVADGADAAVSLLAPGLPGRGRRVALLALAAGGTGLKLARDLADERTRPA